MIKLFRALQHSHDGTADNNNPGDHTVTQAFGQPGLDYSMQRSPRDAMYSSHMVSSHIQSNSQLYCYYPSKPEESNCVLNMFNIFCLKQQVHGQVVQAAIVIMKVRVALQLAITLQLNHPRMQPAQQSLLEAYLIALQPKQTQVQLRGR